MIPASTQKAPFGPENGSQWSFTQRNTAWPAHFSAKTVSAEAGELSTRTPRSPTATINASLATAFRIATELPSASSCHPLEVEEAVARLSDAATVVGRGNQSIAAAGRAKSVCRQTTVSDTVARW